MSGYDPTRLRGELRSSALARLGMEAPGASGTGGTGTPLHDSVGLAFQDNLEHHFLDAAPAPLLSKTPTVHFPLFFQAKNFKWTRMMQMWESNPDLVNCTTSKMRWTALMQASYVAR